MAKDVTKAEEAVLQVLWKQGPMTIRDITAVVYPDDAEAQYSTVKRLLARLLDKGFVDRDSSGFAHIFRAVVDRDELLGRRLAGLADALCEGSLTPLLSSLTKSTKLTERQQEMLQNLITDLDQADQKTTARGRRKMKGRRQSCSASGKWCSAISSWPPGWR